MKKQTPELKELLLMKKKQLSIFFLVVVIGIAIIWLVFSSKNVAISVTDTNMTPDIHVFVYNAETDELLLRGKTNNSGVFKGEIQARSNEDIRISCSKAGYVFKQNEFVSKPSGKPLAIAITLIVKPVKEIVFRVKNSVANIQVDGVDRTGHTKYLGKTGPDGVLITRIQKRDYERISFSYSLAGANVFSDKNQTYYFENLPLTINLKAIPNQALSFYFHCQDDLDSDLSDVYITADNFSETRISTDRYGTASIRIKPTEQRGPFIGDILRWNAEKKNYTARDIKESVIRAGVFTYPEGGFNNPYNFTLGREYKMKIRVLEDNNPVPNIDVFVNNKSYKRTGESGNIVYTYYGKDINKSVTFDVIKEGVSASPQTVKLGNIERSLTFKVKTIHVFLRFVDSTTDEPVAGLTVKRDGKEIGEPAGMGRVKLIFPEIGKYNIGIKDRSRAYLDKSRSLDINQFTIGNEYTVKIDPKTGVSFSLIDKTSGNALKGIHVFRDSKKVGTTDAAGGYAEDYDPDPNNYYTYSFKIDHYLPEEERIYRTPGRSKKDIELEQLKATITLKDEVGNPASNVEVSVGKKIIGTSDVSGKLQFSPKRLGVNYTLKFVSPEELYVTTEETLDFAYNYKKQTFIINRQSWIEMYFTDPGGYSLSEVRVISSTGQTGLSDTSGVFRYKVIDKSAPVDFSFTKSGFEKTSTKIVPKGVMTTERIPMPVLQAYFYVVDSRTDQPVKDLEVRVNGEKQTATDSNGKANIFPHKKPSKLTLYIEAQDGSYIPLKKDVEYTDKNLGQFKIDKRPIEIKVSLHWNTGSAVKKGIIEIDMPYQRYELKSKDRGTHTFDYYSRTSLTLTIKVKTDSGQPFERKHKIIIPQDPSEYSVDVSLILEPKPNVTVLIDEGVQITIIDDDDKKVIDEHDGNYTGELPDFGGYNFVRSGDGFVEADTTYMAINKSELTIDLTRQPLCEEAQASYDNGHWDDFLHKVEQLTLNENEKCYCEKNKQAAEVSMDNLKDYAGALEFYKKITYSTPPCVIDKKDPNNDPYVHLRMLECSVKSQKYEDGIREAEKFDRLVQLLDKKTKKQSINKKDYLLGLLYVDEYWRLCEKSKRVTLSEAKKMKKDLNELRKRAVKHLDKYEKTKKSTPSLQAQLAQIKKGC